VVAEREHVRPGRQETVGEPRREARSVGRVLGVDDAEPGAELLPQPGQPFLDRGATGCPEHVRDEEEFQGRLSVAA
jgi:hypothetical protein